MSDATLCVHLQDVVYVMTGGQGKCHNLVYIVCRTESSRLPSSDAPCACACGGGGGMHGNGRAQQYDVSYTAPTQVI
jgi:hypothetical protein